MLTLRIKSARILNSSTEDKKPKELKKCTQKIKEKSQIKAENTN